MPSARATNPTNCALVGGGLEDSTLRVRRQASGGKNRSVDEDEKTRKCFAFNKQRQRKEQGLQQGLATIPENSVYMTEYDRKGIHVGKEQAKEVKKCRLRDQKNEIKRRSMDDRHMKYLQYLERSALRRSTDSTPDKRGVELTKSFFNKGSFCDTVGSNPSPPMFSRLNGWAGNMFDSEDYE